MSALDKPIVFRVVYPQGIYTNAVLVVFVDDQMIQVPLAGNTYLEHWFQCSCGLMANHYEGFREVVLCGCTYLLKAKDWQNLATVLIDHEAAQIFECIYSTDQ